MSKKIGRTVFPLILACGALFGDEPAPPPFYPFTLSGDYIWVSKAPFTTPEIKDEDIRYRQWDASFAYTHPFNPFWGIIFGAGYTESKVDWMENPAFHETNFGYVNFSVGAYTKSFPCWVWTVTLNGMLDMEVLDFGNYALYQGIAIGSYELSDPVSFKVGFILEVGLHKEKIWPVFGFDFKPWHNWKLDLVYPVNLSLEYAFTPELKAATSVRFLRTRHRLKENEPVSMGIFEYHDTGMELDLNYTPWPWLFIEGFIGSTFNGDLKITDRNNHHATHFKFKGSFYSGFNAFVSF